MHVFVPEFFKSLPALAGTATARLGSWPQARERKGHSSPARTMLYSSPSQQSERVVQFHSFDANYVENLCAGEQRTQEHFVAYFSALLEIKLRSRLRSPQAVEDVRQETFARVYAVLRRDGGLRQPERLGAFVNTVCNNVLFEQYRAGARGESLDDESRPEPAATGADALEQAAARQLAEKVREILLELPERDRALLKAVFLDESDRDEVCKSFGVDREYLRVLLHRAKQGFKEEYIKRLGRRSPLEAGA
jgi:RNA polymerase sigma-70 factor, ECF subfamily